ncbi:N-acetylmuramoyl-L-alanine amidase [Cytobacillus sp. FJAT-53684]|uniref:N-acetylmuramoyl-L-alanine amidase n=1 Tax=Cytobacillus mangrovibacter TaxID=3299024 RepID=A0ABW6K4W0_9BACI
MVHEIELHPGHWKNTGSGANGILNEVTEARKVTKRVYEILKGSSVPCTYFEDNTSSNKNQNLNTLVNHHNADRDGLIVSIHLNAGGDSSKGIGTEVLYSTQKELAAKVANAISDASGLINRGAKQRNDLAVLAKTYEPAILIEVCFVNSSVDAAAYRQNFEKICQAIANELATYLGKSIKEEVKVAETAETAEAKVMLNDNKSIPAFIKDGRTYVQVREIADLLGLKIVYNNESKTTKLYSVN